MLTMKRSFAMLLVLLMLALVFVGCTGEGNGTETGDETDAPETPVTYLDALPQTLDFGGKVFRVLTDGSDEAARSLAFDAPTGDAIDNALYQRNQTVFKRFNTSIEVVKTVNEEEMCDYMREVSLSFRDEYDFVSGKQNAISRAAADGSLALINSLDSIDLTKPYWSQAAIDSMSYKGDVYYVTGDITPGYLGNIYATFVNTDMLKKYYPDLDIYALVESGEWTFEKMGELASKVFYDGDGDGKSDCVDHRELAFGKYPDTVFGMLFNDVFDDSEAMQVAAGVHYVAKDDAGVSKLSYDLDRIGKYVDTLNTMLATEGVFNLVYEGTSPVNRLTFDEQEFSRGTTLFNLSTLDFADSAFRQTKNGYIVIPMPKLDAQQDRYYGLIDGEVNVIGISFTCEDADNAAKLLEALASESYRTVMPAYYNKLTDYAYDANSKDAKMIEMIRESAYSDYAYAYQLGINYSEELVFDDYHQVDEYRKSIYTSSRDYVTRGFSFDDLIKEKKSFWGNDTLGFNGIFERIR